ncbi:MAG: 2-C-methyl-D-erythritol 4-phosphate cytidylyltransferase [Candidatus Margulisbacteria bacterium]|nr:2-C-methyl-D-erythritol 4-phosphate cytidylyltransferase [Candidatus Margulisiibacteriota bacterium]
MKTIAIIAAGGQGKRMGRPKQFLKIAGKPMLWWSLFAFQGCEAIDGIIVVVNKDDMLKVKRFKFSKLLAVVAGGKERQDSVYNGLQALPADTGIVAIHDGARPLVTIDVINQAVCAAKQGGAVVVGVPVRDTIKQMTNDKCQMSNEGKNIIGKTLDRSQLWAAQTPQVFKKEILLKAYKKGYNKSLATDDAVLVEKMGVPVKMVMGYYDNIKITTPEDLAVAKTLLKKRGV